MYCPLKLFIACGRYFRVADAPPYCSDQARCIADEACYAPLLGRQLVGFANESEAVEAATRSVHPGTACINECSVHRMSTCGV